MAELARGRARGGAAREQPGALDRRPAARGRGSGATGRSPCTATSTSCPANAADWQVDPFAAEERDGCIWGRGAVDMKDMDAMILANLREFARTGTRPARTTTFVFFADEEAGGVHGSHWLVDKHPGWFEGVTEAVSEVGGYSVTVADSSGRAARLPAADRGEGHHLAAPPRAWPRWPRVGAQRRERDRAARRGHRPHRGPRVAPRVHRHGQAAPRRPQRAHRHRAVCRRARRRSWPPRGAQGFVRATLQDTANVTMLEGGYKHNVIPQTRVGRRRLPLPAWARGLAAVTVRELAGEHVEVEVVHRDIALEAPWDGDLVEAMKQSLLRADPGATVLPYCLSGGTDNKALAGSASEAMASRHCACRPASTSRRCSTASTSGCRSTRSGSERGCWATSSGPAEPAEAALRSGSALDAHDLSPQPEAVDAALVPDRPSQLPPAVLGVLTHGLTRRCLGGAAVERQDAVLVLGHRRTL